MANYAYGKTLPSVENGAVLQGHNFTQFVQNTPIFEGITGLTFAGCNLVNCSVPADANVVNCNIRQFSRCSHVHPELVGFGLTECSENCIHVVDADVLEIDGEVVETVYHYEDTVV